MEKKKIFLFDLDGVLIDSKKNMQLSWETTANARQIKIPFNKYFRLIGLPFRKILTKLKIKKKHHVFFEKKYKENSLKNIKFIKLKKGVRKTLYKLKLNNKIVGLLTSKEKSRTLAILQKYKIKMDFVFCPHKNLYGKPHPRQINILSRKTKVSKKEIVYIGDMFVDKQTAKNAKVDYIHANYGYSKKMKSKYSINQIYDIITKNLGLY